MFCDKEGGSSLPADKGNMLAFIGYLSLEGRVGPRSAPQYVSAIWRYHEDSEFKSPTKMRLVSRVLKAYANMADWEGEIIGVRTSLEALVMRQIMKSGLNSDNVHVIESWAMVAFEYVFQCSGITASHVQLSDATVDSRGVIHASLHRHKAKNHSRVLKTPYPSSPTWEYWQGSIALFMNWKGCGMNRSGISTCKLVMICERPVWEQRLNYSSNIPDAWHLLGFYTLRAVVVLVL